MPCTQKGWKRDLYRKLHGSRSILNILSQTESISDEKSQRPRKHFESGGALGKRGTFLYDQNETTLCRSRAERKFLKIWSLYNVWNGLYRVFTTAKRALSFQQKRAIIQEIRFSFFKWGTLAQKKGHFFTFKKVGGGGGGGGTCPHCPPVPRPLKNRMRIWNIDPNYHIHKQL
jgi:hypothetical protein